jgi:protein-disulfide isomerase
MLITISALLLLAGPTATAQESSDDLARRVAALERQQRETLRDLTEIKRLLAVALQGGTVPAAEVAGNRLLLHDNPVQGDPDAPLTLIEFTDYECGYCARYHREAYPQIVAAYVATGRVRYVTLDLPLESLHPLSFRAARATHCAEEQGKFWEMQDRLFTNKQFLGAWAAHAEAVGLEAEAFLACLDSDRHASAVRRDASEAAKVGASGTPAFVIARTLPGEPREVESLVGLRGAQPFSVFAAELDRALAEVESRTP